MTANEFIFWLRGFVEYQQLQGNNNPAFNTIKNRLDEVGEVKPKTESYSFPTTDAISVSVGTGEYNSSVTYKTDVPITYTLNGDAIF